ncbi:MAG: hypothetical protein SFW36_13675 [Leptolyngbyaceae cyanobacterium bins.59]|nr:hypothetical protein [Leptolyngbyaceae cyanobacterium bins.59]
MKVFNLPSPLLLKILAFGQGCLQRIAAKPSVRIQPRMNRGVNKGWHGYDPETGEYVAYGTEMEMRTWLEQRYRR